MEVRFSRVDTKFEHMEQKFEHMEQKFEQMDRKFEQRIEESADESRRHMGVLYEAMQHKMDLVIEGFSASTPKFIEHDKRIRDLELDVSILKTVAQKKG